ncbi:MAG: ABC transporter ATP-binding protein [Gaiellaceae bacterium MAG52_C11]|nr:ABC transporter ATP-binding protein [Candidatus Gaiellasilicea maunaloa]
MATVTFENVTKRFDDTVAVDELTLEISDGEFLVLVGPSGCGKSTALRMLAGLEETTSGRILIGDRVVNNLAPGARDVAMVFQSYALYPHMTVYDNLAFGLRNVRTPKDEINRRVSKAAEVLDMTELIKRKPKQLSGGQRQRVALGRAIVRQPKAFLMDEPLSNLDAALRVNTRAEILKLQRDLKVTTVYVTHDQVEAMTMGDRIAVMKQGVLQQAGTPEQLYTKPTNVFVARFIGSPAMNLVPAGFVKGAGTGGQLAGFRPEHVVLGGGNGDAAYFQATVEVVEYLGDEQLVHLAAGDEKLLAKLPVEDRVPTGVEQRFSIPRDKLHLFDAETELAVRA